MSQKTHFLSAPSSYEFGRISRRPLAGAGLVSTRSKSAPGLRHGHPTHVSENELKIPAERADSSSQRTVIEQNAMNAPPVDAIEERAEETVTTPRINSDPSSSTSRSTTTRPEGLRIWNERDAIVPRSNLTEIDVAALILNKMIGTGIFTTPGAVLAFTKSKNMSVALWTVGGLWTALFSLVYLEFGNALPFNGGELIYLDEIYRRPELLFTILFSGFFLSLANSYGNSIQFAKHVLLSAQSDVEFSTDLDPRLVRYIAISVVTCVCLIHYFSSKAGLFLNKLLAFYKIILLIVVFIAGYRYSDSHGSQWNDDTLPPSGSSVEGLAAMVLIFYTYQGWENANYVAGEIRALEGRTPARTLKIGAFLAVGTVWILYVLVSVAYYKVLDYATITGSHSDLGVALYFAPKVFGGSLGLKICMAISALGNVIAVTYTSAKVKQTIAIQRFLPFWRFLIRDSDTPKGALVLHWISSVLMIALCPTNSDGYSFSIGLFTYGHIFFSTLVALALFGLKNRMRESYPKYRLSIFRGKAMVYTVPIVFALGNILVLIFAAKANSPGKIARYWWPLTLIFILFGSFLYWAAMMVTQVKITYKGEEKTLGSVLGLEFIVNNKNSKTMPDEMKEDIAEALAVKIDGSRRRIECKTSGRLARIAKGAVKMKDVLARWLF